MAQGCCRPGTRVAFTLTSHSAHRSLEGRDRALRGWPGRRIPYGGVRHHGVSRELSILAARPRALREAPAALWRLCSRGVQKLLRPWHFAIALRFRRGCDSRDGVAHRSGGEGVRPAIAPHSSGRSARGNTKHSPRQAYAAGTLVEKEEAAKQNHGKHRRANFPP